MYFSNVVRTYVAHQVPNVKEWQVKDPEGSLACPAYKELKVAES